MSVAAFRDVFVYQILLHRLVYKLITTSSVCLCIRYALRSSILQRVYQNTLPYEIYVCASIAEIIRKRKGKRLTKNAKTSIDKVFIAIFCVFSGRWLLSDID